MLMKNKSSFWDAVPEIDQHEVRYSGKLKFNFIYHVVSNK